MGAHRSTDNRRKRRRRHRRNELKKAQAALKRQVAPAS